MTVSTKSMVPAPGGSSLHSRGGRRTGELTTYLIHYGLCTQQNLEAYLMLGVLMPDSLPFTGGESLSVPEGPGP